MTLKLIAAIGKNRELGKNNDLPLWRLSTDQKRFRELTTGCTVVMGRKTFLSFPEKYQPLPNRRNIILTRDENFKIDGAESFASLDGFLEDPRVSSETAWVIGGGDIYRQFINQVNELHITHVDGEFMADTFFPEIDMAIWKKVSEEFVAADEKNSHSTIYTIYNKK